jgi:glycosyltransferase involved in cell wall biosynthesis
LQIALDATYSVGDALTGVGVYSSEIIGGLIAAHTAESRWRLCFRPHTFRRGWRELGRGRFAPARACLLQEAIGGVPPYTADLFHGLNQRLPRRRLRRAVATFHDLFVLTGEYSTAEFRERFAGQARQAAERADLVIAVSHYTADAVSALLNVEASRVRVIPHGFRFRAAAPAGAERQQRPREPIVLHVGALQKRKNVAALVRAFEHVDPEWRLVLAGAQDGYGANEALEAIERSPRRAAITLAGHVTDQELAGLFARASVLAFPSLDEGFGIPLLEAMAARVAVLTSDRSALKETAGDAALLVDPFNERALAEGLRKITSDADLRAELISRGASRVAGFSWTGAVEKTWNVYKELL